MVAIGLVGLLGVAAEVGRSYRQRHCQRPLGDSQFAAAKLAMAGLLLIYSDSLCALVHPSTQIALGSTMGTMRGGLGIGMVTLAARPQRSRQRQPAKEED